MIAETNRQLANLFTLGTVADVQGDMARVTVGDAGDDAGVITTDYIPWLTTAGTTTAWHAPSLGEQVLLAAVSGDMAQAVIVGSLYSNTHAAPSTAQHEHMLRLPDNTTVIYNHQSHTLTVLATGTAKYVAAQALTIKSDTEVHVQAPSVVITATTVSITGNTTISGMLSVTGEVTSGGISLPQHTHAHGDPAGDTGAAQ